MQMRHSLFFLWRKKEFELTEGAFCKIFCAKGCETKEKGSSRKSYGHTNVLVDMMQNYPGFMDYIAYQYPLEGERIELLEQILTALAVGRKLEAEQMIYHYGSMIHGRDLIARQVFLWLLGMAEYSRRECIAEERR